MNPGFPFWVNVKTAGGFFWQKSLVVGSVGSWFLIQKSTVTRRDSFFGNLTKSQTDFFDAGFLLAD